MASLFFQFRPEPGMREQEYENVLQFSGLQEGDLIRLFGPKLRPGIELLQGADALIFGATGQGSLTRESSQILEPWIRLLKEARARRIPMIGFNYGAHLMTLAFGGSVTRDEDHKEVGSRLVRKTPEAAGDPLLSALPDAFMVQVGHIDRMAELPPDARRLLTSDSWQNMCWGMPSEGIYATEFQLDLDQESLTKRLIDYQATYVMDPGELEHAILSLKPSPESVKILRYFFERVVRYSKPAA